MLACCELRRAEKLLIGNACRRELLPSACHAGGLLRGRAASGVLLLQEPGSGAALPGRARELAAALRAEPLALCSTAGGNSNPQQQQQQLQKTCIPTAALLSDLSTRFVRVHGALPLLPSIIRPSSNLLKFRFLKYPKNFKPLLQCPSCHIYACSDTTSPKLPGVAHCTR
jgi:hypothetical protein